VDVANLTGGTGAAVLSGLETKQGEGLPGRFSLENVLDRIEAYAAQQSPAPIATRWVVNYPHNAPAVVICSSKNYYVEPIPEGEWIKGSDDVILMNKINEVHQQYPTVSHFVLVLGDKDYKHGVIDPLLKAGKVVRVVSRRSALAGRYRRLAQDYPERFALVPLEELLEGKGAAGWKRG
jgi:hypothetical protein